MSSRLSHAPVAAPVGTVALVSVGGAAAAVPGRTLLGR